MNIFQRLRSAWRKKPTTTALDIWGNGFKASSGYNAGSMGRRGWEASRLGSNTLLLQNLAEVRARSRDAIRNSAVAASAIDHFESNVVGSGIVPHFLYPDPDIAIEIQDAWNRWVKQCDHAGQLNFYGLQALVTRELFEAGESFVRFHLSEDGLKLQVLPSEQCPEYIVQETNSPIPDTIIKSGIIFDQDDRRVAYRFYQYNPYDTTFGQPGMATQFITIPVEDMLHIMKPLRAGQIRGVPKMAPVLASLHDIEDYCDSERLRKKISTTFAFFVKRPVSEDRMFPTDPYSQPNATGTDQIKLEPGTIFDLLPGEEVTAPEIPNSGDYTSFMVHELHKIAQACGITYEMLTGDLTKVNYSSARVALLEFRRAAEQFQAHIIVQGFLEPVVKRWMKEAVLSGELELPSDYITDPEEYERCVWVAPGWNWINPKDEVEAYEKAVRDGFISRTMVVRETGYDPAVIDNQIAEERKREKRLGIVTDTNANVVLLGRETQPETPTTAKPERDSDEVAEEETDPDQ